METKFIDLRELKMSDASPGTIEGYRSVFGELDSGGDIVVKGAFKDFMPEYLQSGFTAHSHDWNFSEAVGFPVDAKEDEHGWYVTSQFHSTPDAQAIRTKAKERMDAGKTVGFSFGYKADDFQYVEAKDFKSQLPQFIKADRLEANMQKAQKFNRIRILKKVSAIEDSLVTNPMNQLATATGVKAVWSTSYQNNLPDSSFAYIESGGSKDKDGKTTPRSLRHFPYKDTNGKEDEAHVRNALSRIPQSKLPQAAKDAALKKIKAAAGRLGINTGKSDYLEAKGMFEDVLEEREEGLYFLFDVLCCAIYRAQMLDENSEDMGDGSFDLATALDEILAEFSARVKDAIAGPEEEGEEDSMESMADTTPISFKGDLRVGTPSAKLTETVLAAVEVFATKSASLAEFISEFAERRKAIMETRFKEGRTYSAGNLAHMQRVHDALGKVKKDVSKVHGDMGALIEKAKAPEKSDENLESAALRTQAMRTRSNAIRALAHV